ncbi:amidohydrolase [Brevibacillus choshinensis]|uniref:Amidohydrolase n=1 Tax=Brevibacillus choshinensis TaxID=54911 RepID=A0ABR5NDN4_BRECH|nr:amidohydrolase [Brevibacillus choshinensis]KQL49675.1 amidohydrolase [Brevibacillus choshinensis]
MNHADLVFLNGQVITINKQNEVAEAVAVKENRIVAVGSNQQVNKWIGDSTQVIDLRGRSLLPGFIDSHTHLEYTSTWNNGVDFKEKSITSVHDALQALRQEAQKTPEGKCVRGFGYNERQIAEQRLPTKSELDQITSENPIVILRACGHIAIVNSKTLEIMGIQETTPDPEGGKIGRNEKGELTGVLYETAREPVMGKLFKYTLEETRKAMSLASEQMLATGITSIHDAGGTNIMVLKEAVSSGEVKLRVYAMIAKFDKSETHEEMLEVIESGNITGSGDDRFRFGPVKVFTDGSSSGPTAAMREPYNSNPNESGILYYSQEELNRILGEAHEKGFQITAHAQGDRAIEMMLNCFEEALKKHPRTNHRHRIEHAGITMPDLIERMKQLEVVPIPNPAFFLEYGDAYLKHYGDRVNYQYPARDFIDSGVVAAGGSDSPVTSYNPLLGIYGAVSRLSPSGQVVGANQRINVMEAIRLFTWNGAYASFEEDIKGSIETGKLADLVVLSEPILDIQPERIQDVKVELTVLDGEIVYQKN